MKNLTLVFLILVNQFGCSQRKAIHDTSEQKDICLNYTFGENYPYAFKFYNGKIVIGDGRNLIMFSNDGKETYRLTLPDTFMDGQTFLDFLPITDTAFYVTVLTDLYKVTSNKQELINQHFGELIKGEADIVVTNFQNMDSASNPLNSLRMFNQINNSVLIYPSKKDLGTYNFEVFDGLIALCTPDHTFGLLPVDDRKKPKFYNVPFDDFYSFLGMSDGNFVFSTRDYAKKEDHLHFFDANMRFVKEAILDVSYEEISDTFKQSHDFYMEAPFGNFFSFDKQTKNIYVFRLRKGNVVCYFPIDKYLRIVKKGE